jgi:hypothetical protein
MSLAIPSPSSSFTDTDVTMIMGLSSAPKLAHPISMSAVVHVPPKAHIAMAVEVVVQTDATRVNPPIVSNAVWALFIKLDNVLADWPSIVACPGKSTRTMSPLIEPAAYVTPRNGGIVGIQFALLDSGSCTNSGAPACWPDVTMPRRGSLDTHSRTDKNAEFAFGEYDETLI